MTSPGDLYDALDIDPQAEDESEEDFQARVKAGWKAALKRAHPDVSTGSRASFDRVQTALVVLSNPKKRDRYDRTGKFDAEPEPSNEMADFLDHLATLLDSVVDDPKASPNKVKNVDILNEVLQALPPLHEQGEQMLKQLATRRARWQEVYDRAEMREEKTFNPIRRIAQSRIELVDKQEESTRKIMEHVKKVAELVGRMRYRTDPLWPPDLAERYGVAPGGRWG